MRLLSIAKFAAAFGFVALFLTACVPQSPGPHPLPPGSGWDRPPQRACTMEYRPVCAERRGHRQTFGNSCVAEAEGFRVVHRGECRRSDDRRPPQRACTREFAPVCARRGNQMRTFGNACMADAAGYRIERRGPC